MSNIKNTHKSNQYECLGKDAESSLGLNILWSSVAGVAETPMLATTTSPEVISPNALQNKTSSL